MPVDACGVGDYMPSVRLNTLGAVANRVAGPEAEAEAEGAGHPGTDG